MSSSPQGPQRSAEYEPIHPPDAITANLPREKQCVCSLRVEPSVLSDASNCSLGPVDQSTLTKIKIEITDEERARLKRVEARPPLSEILNLHDFEVDSAIHLAGPTYNSSYPSRNRLSLGKSCRRKRGLTTLPPQTTKSPTGRTTLRITGRFPPINNPSTAEQPWPRIWFRPRVLRDVTSVDFSTRILGQPTKMPIYIVRAYSTASPCKLY